MADVKRLRELLSGGKDRPWHVYNQADDDGVGYRCYIDSPDQTADWVAQEVEKPDADLIVAAVNALPALLDVVEAAKHWKEFWCVPLSGAALAPAAASARVAASDVLAAALDRWEDSDAR